MCQINGLIVDKIEIIVVKAIQPRRHYPTCTYKGEPIQVVQSLNYPSINFPSTNTWNIYYESRLQDCWNNDYTFENHCNQSDTWGWKVRLMLFNVVVCFKGWMCKARLPHVKDGK